MIDVPTEVIQNDGNTTQRVLRYEFSQSVPTTASAGSFTMQITDPNDPSFLYDYSLEPADFPRVKENQKLFCEFPDFSRSVHALLSKCIEASCYRASIDERNPDEPTLRLLQTTEISLLCHLWFGIIPANDKRLNGYLVGEVNYFKQKLYETEETLAHLRDDSAMQKRMNDDSYQGLQAKFEQMKAELEQKLENERSTAEKEKQQLKEQADTAREQMTKDHHSEVVTMKEQQAAELERIRKEMNDLNTEKLLVTAEKEKQSIKIANLEAQISELQATLAKTDAERAQLNADLLESTKKCGCLEKELQAAQSQVELTETQLGAQKSQSGEYSKSVFELRKIIEEKDTKIKEVEERAKLYEAKAKERDYIAEMSKKVISQHKADQDNLMQHYTKKKQMLAESEEARHQAEKQLIKAQEEIKASQLVIENEQTEKHKLEGTLQSLREQIAELERKAESDANMISMLERNLDTKYRDDLDTFTDAGDFTSKGTTPPKKEVPPDGIGGYLPELNYQSSSIFGDVPFY